MRLAIIYWRMIHSVGGIATHLNSLRTAAIKYGDTCDILMSDSQKSKRAQVFPERKWVAGGDTKIWIDGELPHHPTNVESSLQWLEDNYDAILFSQVTQHKTTAYPEPHFKAVYESRLPKASLCTDGFWDKEEHWGEELLPRLLAVFAVAPSYSIPLQKRGYSRLVQSCQPFQPRLGNSKPRSKTPLIVWPNQWKDLKGIKPFLEQVPKLHKSVGVDLYSCGIRYYQLRKEPCWREAVKKDLFKGYNGDGRAIYYGNVDQDEITDAYQRAWFTVNLHGMRSKLESYIKGSYNYTEVEALWYGACPILHERVLQTIIPRDCYIAVASPDEIPNAVHEAIKSGFALSPERQRKAREFVIKYHLASKRYLDIRNVLTGRITL